MTAVVFLCLYSFFSSDFKSSQSKNISWLPGSTVSSRPWARGQQSQPLTQPRLTPSVQPLSNPAGRPPGQAPTPTPFAEESEHLSHCLTM